eukprot:2168910-Pyramimonas_sp.AAC.1
MFQSCLAIWGELLMAPPPRGEQEGGGAGGIIRGAACARPLSMSNTDAKILSAVFCHPLNEFSTVTVAPLQKCAEGRQLLADVAQAEKWGLQQELIAHDSAAILSTDFPAASPSLLR